MANEQRAVSSDGKKERERESKNWEKKKNIFELFESNYS